MENYLVSEMFNYKIEKKKNDLTPNDAPKCTRGSTPSTFYNEIYHSDEEILDTSRMNACCNRRKAWLSVMLERGRELCAQELNITRLVASTRCSVIADSFIGESGVQRLKKRKISLAAVRKDKYPKNQFKIKLNKQFKDLLSSQSAQRSSND